MYFSKKGVQRIGLFAKGTYDAEIESVQELIDCWNDEDTLYWRFTFNIIQHGKFCKYEYCLKYSEEKKSEFAYVMTDLRCLLAKNPSDPIKLEELSHLPITLELDYDIEIGHPVLKEAIFRNYIAKISRPKRLGVWLEALENKAATSAF